MWIFPQIGWRSVSGATLVVSAALLGGCVVAPVDPGYAYSYTTYGSPPPVRYEAVPVAPSAGYVWTPGLWLWGGSRYDWRPGYWGSRQPGWGPRGGYRNHGGYRGYGGHRGGGHRNGR